MKQYKLSIFLLTEASVTRVCNMLLAKGFAVEPNFSNKEDPNTPLLYVSDKRKLGIGGAIMNIIVHNERGNASLREVGKSVEQGMKEQEIPFYGMTVLPSDAESATCFGFMPPIKQKPKTQPKPLLSGSCQGAEVISLRKKGDGIIEDTK